MQRCRRSGFIEVLPIILLAAFVLITTIITLEAQRQTQQLVGRAAQGVYPPTATPTPPPIPYCSYSVQEHCTCGCTPTTSGGTCNVCPTATPTPPPIPYCSYSVQEHCGYGCAPTLSGGTCKPAPTPTPPVIITMSDYDKCIASGNTPAECKNILDHIGQPITTLLGQQECTPGTAYYSGNTLHQCSSSGTWGLRTCQYGYNSSSNACNTPPPTTTNLLAGLEGLSVSGLSGSTAIPLPQSAVSSTQGFQQWESAVFGGMGTGLAVGSLALGGAALLPAGGLPVAALMAQNAIAASPVLQTVAAVATLSQAPLAIIACQTYGADSPACQMTAAGITAGFFTDPIGTLQGLQASAQQVSNVVDQGFNAFINSPIGNTLFGNPQIGPLDSMYSFNEYTLTARPQLPSELSPLEAHIQSAADLINQGNYTEALQLLGNQQLAAELGVKIDYGYWTPIPSQFRSAAMTNDDFFNLANNTIAASGQHSPGIVTLPSVGYPITEDYIWGTPLPEPLVREQAAVALEEWVHELQMRNNQLLGIPYTGSFSTTQHEDEIALYFSEVLRLQLSEPFLSRYNRQILGLPGYNLTNFLNP